MSFLLFSALTLGAVLGANDPGRLSATLAQDAPASFPQWSGALSAGTIFTEGNSITSSANANFNAVRRGEKDRQTYDAFWNWGTKAGFQTGGAPFNEDDTELTQRNWGGGAKYDYFSTPKFYYYGNLSAKTDDVATLDYRYIAGAGSGYQWKESEKLKWGTEAGLSWVQEDYVDNSANARSLAVRLGSNLFYQVTKTTVFEQVVEVLPSLKETEDLIAKLDNRLKMNITGKWIAQLQYVLDFDDSVPGGSQAGVDGQKETDHRVVLSLGWSFGG